MVGSQERVVMTGGGSWVTRDRVVAVIAAFADGREQVGSGYLVSRRLVLTAAHCTWHKKTREPPIRRRVIRASDGAGADVAVEMIGRAETVEAASKSVGVGGRVVIMGVARKEARAQVAPFELMLKEAEIIGSNANAYGFVPAIRLIESGSIPVDKIVSHELPIADALKAFDLCSKGEGLKVLIRPG